MTKITVKGLGKLKFDIESVKGTVVENHAFKNTALFRAVIHTDDGSAEHFYSLDNGKIWTPFKPTLKQGEPPDVDIIDAVARDVPPELPSGEDK
jgi:hypothetical protein